MKHRWTDMHCFDGLYNGIMTVVTEQECRGCGKKRRVPENAKPLDNEECPGAVSLKAPQHPLDCQHKDLSDELRHFTRKQGGKRWNREPSMTSTVM